MKIKHMPDLAKAIEDALSKAASAVTYPLKEQMIRDIVRGVSPVRGERFQKYSESYKKAIKKGYVKKGIAPINLKLTGKMLSSLITESKGRIVSIIWTDPKASYHNNGTKNLPRRAILPKTNERFNEKILQIITKAVKAALAKI